MKIAICFSGSIRDFHFCYPSLKRHLLNPLGADIFLHLWSMTDVSSLPGDNLKWRSDGCSPEYVVSQLKPVRYTINNYDKNWENKILNECEIDVQSITDPKNKLYAVNACCMYYKIRECYRLLEDYCREKTTTYDIVIRARLDFIWEESMDATHFNPLEQNVLYLIKDRYATLSRLNTNDKFFAGSMGVMKKMCCLFDCLKSYSEQGCSIEGQQLHEHHIVQSSVDVHWIGSIDTYYKCAKRHSAQKCKTLVVIHNTQYLTHFTYELAYYLLSNNYAVHTTGPLEHSSQEVLASFTHFNSKEKLTPLCHIYLPSNNKIVVANSLTQSTVTFNGLFDTVHLVHFVSSILYTRTFNKQYVFNTRSLVQTIEPNEPVMYKYLDHGYYRAHFMCTKGDKYIVHYGRIAVQTTRPYIKILDLTKYVHDTIMPTNIE